MKTQHFLAQVDHDRLHRAIQAAEEGTAARIVVYISQRPASDPLKKASALFQKLGLEKEGEHAGLLLFFAPTSRKFAVVGGTALHDKLGQLWWDEIARIVTSHFKEDRYMEGLLAAVHMAGLEFQRHYASKSPHDKRDIDIVED